MATNNDKYYVTQIKKGNTLAFRGLVDEYKHLVFSLALRMLKSREEAEEVSQDTFVKVFKSIQRFKGDSKLSTWIYRIAYNTCLDNLKKNRPERHYIEINEISENLCYTLENAFELMAKKERETLVQACLKDLPAEDAAILTLFYFQEKKLKEIEATMNISISTIKVRLFRARKRLAAILIHRMEPEISQHYG